MGLAMVKGGSTFSSQEQVWNRLASMGLDANYVVVANPNDQ